MSAKTLYDKIWDAHVAHEAEDGTCLLYIDRHLVHEVTSPQAFEGLRMAASRSRHWTRTHAISAFNITRCRISVRASCISSAPNRAGPCPA
jgi:3-isopropylmalate/(R)-2-methylmalate dehydratase large subunit